MGHRDLNFCGSESHIRIHSSKVKNSIYWSQLVTIEELLRHVTFEKEHLIVIMKSEKLYLIIGLLLSSVNKCVCPFKRQKLCRKIAKLYILYNDILRSERNARKRKFWVRPIFNAETRLQQGASDNLVKEMMAEDIEKYVDYFRMPHQLFEALLALVGPIIDKQYVIREPISPNIRLQITLRYLASGDSMKSLSYAFRVGHDTISKIISETCEAIWNCLKDSVFLKDNQESWKAIADEFERLWNFPNCIGAIDGKHVQIQVHCSRSPS
jgi:hypothetical protein